MWAFVTRSQSVFSLLTSVGGLQDVVCIVMFLSCKLVIEMNDCGVLDSAVGAGDDKQGLKRRLFILSSVDLPASYSVF